jgi:phosphoglycolate phosphatase
MIYDAVIFDIDGTLWNASSASAKGWNLGLESIGLTQRVTAEQVESVAGNSYEECIDILLPGQKKRHAGLLDALNEYETKVVTSDGGEFYHGVVAGIIRLASDCRVYLVSNCQEWYLNLFLDFSQLGPVFSGVDCYGMSGLPKNEMLSRTKRTHSLQNPVYVGDTASDEKAAALAGIPFIHVAWGFGKPEGKPKIVHSFDELLDHLKGKPDKNGPNNRLHRIADKSGLR